MIQIKAHEIQSECKKTLFYCVSGQKQEQIAQNGCGTCILGDVQSLTGHSPGQPTVADPA